MAIKLDTPIVSVDWLHQHLKEDELIIFDATIPKVNELDKNIAQKEIIEGALFFDLKHVFSDQNSVYPNTVPSTEIFEREVNRLGVQNSSCIVVYDDLGVYASPRVWWLFRLMGFSNIAVLNGGLKAWQTNGYSTSDDYSKPNKKGNFKAHFTTSKIKTVNQVLEATKNKNSCLLDARSEARFYAKVPEPRKGLRGGHMPNAESLPYTDLLKDTIFKSNEILIQFFDKANPENQEMIFSCGSGITACILALASEIIGRENYAVYDGSWTEWASIEHLPIAK